MKKNELHVAILPKLDDEGFKNLLVYFRLLIRIDEPRRQGGQPLAVVDNEASRPVGINAINP